MARLKSAPAPTSVISAATGKKSRTILPNNKFASAAAASLPTGATRSVSATQNFEEAVETCKLKVAKIAAECRVANRKYRDYHFDLRGDERYCLDGLTESLKSELFPAGVARVGDVFEEPRFFKDGVSAGDIQQGATGDCWFMAAVATITSVPGLVERVCVARDELVGIYGFIFMRDGEWISTIIDDQLFLNRPEYHDADWYTQLTFSGKEKEYNTTFARGSKALEFAKCEDTNETWLPLLEKAYAKAHGDYGSIDGGWTGEAVEDLTGGATSEVYTCDILDKDRFWTEELSLANKDFLFAASLSGVGDRSGILTGHAYSVLKAKEVKGKRFVLVRNPWGRTEWIGAWSDGSKEWTAEWMTLLEHRFGDDGAFWMSYSDFLHKFSEIDRTRLFDPSWTVTSRWVKVPVPWAMEYSGTRFELLVSKKSQVVLVLSQLDQRYFRGLEGQYRFSLHFRLQREGETEYIMRSRSNVGMSRSVNAEVELEPGKYVVVFKITAQKIEDSKPVTEVIKKSKKNRKKFMQIGMSYDLAHAKASVMPEDEKKIQEAVDKAKKGREKAKEKEKEKEKEEKEKEKEKDGEGEGEAGKGKGEEEEKDDGAKEENAKDDTGGAADGAADGSAGAGSGVRGKPRASFGKLKWGLRSDGAEPEAEAEASAEAADAEGDKPDGETEGGGDDEDEDEESWDAVACVGLRVYAQDHDLTVQVVYQNSDSEDALDLDDAARDAAVGEEKMEKEEKEKEKGEEGQKAEKEEAKKDEEKGEEGQKAEKEKPEEK